MKRDSKDNYQEREDRYFINDRPEDPAFDIRYAGISYPNPGYVKRRDRAMNVYVFEYVLRGCGRISGCGVSADLREGDFYIINTKFPQVYYADHEEPFEKIWVNASGALLARLAEIYIGDQPFVIRHDSRAAYERFREIHQILCDEQLTREEAFDRAALILHGLMQFMRSKKTSSVGQDAGLAASVRDYIDRNLYRNLLLDEIAEKYFVSKNHLIRSFLEAFAITPKQYQLRRRADMAEALMDNTGMSLEEIAMQLGFSSLQHFSAAYRAQRGFSPQKHKMRGDS